MNRSIAEANMSIDDSLIILNGALNTFDDEQPHLSDKQEIENELEFSSKIEPANTVEVLSGEQSDSPNDDLNKAITQRDAELVDGEIEFAKQNNANQPTEAVPKENAQVALSIQQIVDQAKPDDPEAMQQATQQAGIEKAPSDQPAEQPAAMERKVTVQKLLFIAQNDQTTKSNGRPANESTNQSAANHQNEVEMNADESLRLNDSQPAKANLSTKSSHEVDMSVDDSLVLNDIRNIFETSTSSSEFIITKPLKKIETPKRLKNRESEMDVSCSENDSLILKEVKIENNPIDCLDESPYLKSLPPPKQVFKLARKRLNCETESPIKKPNLSSNLFKSHFSTTPLISANKKWRSATYNPMTSSPKKMELVSPLKPIDSNIICSTISNAISSATIDNLLVSNLNMMIQKSDQQPNLMGDYSSTYALPLISGRHKDLKTISPETLAKLIKGDYQKSISHFTIVDSRYPYEYQAGHIDGSKNLYHKEEINKYFFGVDNPTPITKKALIDNAILDSFKQSSSNSMRRPELKNSNFNRNSSSKRLSVIQEGENDENKEANSEPSQPVVDLAADSPGKRHAIIFHCEFSSERGPSMCRYLRKIDRELNENCYPNLYYPEIYLLHGGYKLFFEKFKSLCYPQTYLPMHSTDHKQDLIKFRTKSKSWNCERKFKSVSN